ncbi:MAG: N4-gp56 family major capsid protein [Clostridia bacterium]|nr:N4-gp56 family major capsid protein [Clostridia bacterium]
MKKLIMMLWATVMALFARGEMDLETFGNEGNVVNATVGYVNANTGTVTAFDTNYTLDPTLKTYYDTELLENSRDKRYFAQFGMKQPLPRNKGKTAEWRKFKTIPPAIRPLNEGINPNGRKLGEMAITKTVTQHGDFIEKTDVLDLHAIDNMGLAATEELGAAAAQTQDLLIRNEVICGTNVLCADTIGSDDTVTENNIRWKMTGKAYLTGDMVAQAVTKMEVDKVPQIDGRYYVAIIHPYCKYDIRKDPDWVHAHEYAAVEEIFNGEIGELHGARFVVTTNAKVWAPKPLNGTTSRYLSVTAYANNASTTATAGTATAYRITVSETPADDLVGRYVLLEQSGAITEQLKIVGINNTSKYLYLEEAPANTPANGNYLNPGEGGKELHTDGKQNAVFACVFLGKDAYGIVDPDGAGLEMIYHDKRLAGGALELKSTIGYKFETATAILYQERMLRVECLSKYSGTAKDVLDEWTDEELTQY